MSKFYAIKKIRAENGSSIGRVDVYGLIDQVQFWGDEVSPSSFLADLNALGVITEIEVHIFSNGGDMFASLAIYSILKSRSEKISVFIEGIAASGGSIIACAGDVVYMPAAAMMFVHNALTDAWGVNEHDARKLADELEKLKEPMIAAYMEKSGRTREEIIALLDGADKKGTWLTATEAIEFGFADDYTPDNRLPLEAAACISPGVFNYKGYKIDFSGYDKAAEKTAGIINLNRGGNSMGFFGKKKNKVAAKVKPKVEITFVEMVCPSCSGAVNLNPDTGEVYASNVQQTEPKEGTQDNNSPAATLAKRIPCNVRAAIYSVCCPHCGNDFAWDTDINADGEDGQQLGKSVPIGSGTNSKPKTEPEPAPSAALEEASCPNCGAAVEYDTETAQTGTDDTTGTEGYSLTCSECNTQFIEPFTAAASEAVPVGAEAQAAYRAGILAERNRQLALDEIAQAVPDLLPMIQAAKKTGASAETMSRNVIKAMAQGNVNTNGNQFATAINRDVQASGVNNMRIPQHAAKPQSIFQTAYEKYAAEYNKGRGGKEDGKA